MFRPGANPNQIQMSDVLCDFCHSPWTDDRPMVEGHQGGCVCGRCLSVAYGDVVVARRTSAASGYTCRMCLEERDDLAWTSPLDADAAICERCIRLGAQALEKDAESGWKRPR